jgi:hypothetical protein
MCEQVALQYSTVQYSIQYHAAKTSSYDTVLYCTVDYQVL